jgi:hypothetical protein
MSKLALKREFYLIGFARTLNMIWQRTVRMLSNASPVSRIKYIVGCDPSLRNFGVSVHDNAGIELSSFCVSTTAGLADHHSVDALVSGFFGNLEKYLTPSVERHAAAAFFFEDIYGFGSGKGTARAEATGAIKWLLRQQGYPIYGLTPKAVISFMSKRYGLVIKGSNGKQKKLATINALHKQFNFYTPNDNIADAYMLAKAGYSYLIERQRMSIRALSQLSD